MDNTIGFTPFIFKYPIWLGLIGNCVGLAHRSRSNNCKIFPFRIVNDNKEFMSFKNILKMHSKSFPSPRFKKWLSLSLVAMVVSDLNATLTKKRLRMRNWRARAPSIVPISRTKTVRMIWEENSILDGESDDQHHFSLWGSVVEPRRRIWWKWSFI